jgi:hypothetical protein
MAYPIFRSEYSEVTLHAGYAASRISFNLKGCNKQFGWLQASATNVSSLSIISANPATNL